MKLNDDEDQTLYLSFRKENSRKDSQPRMLGCFLLPRQVSTFKDLISLEDGTWSIFLKSFRQYGVEYVKGTEGPM